MSDHETEVKSAEEAVKEAAAARAEAKRKAAHQEYPKWVDVHESHIHRKETKDDDGRSKVHVSTPEFPHFHVDRAGKVTVFVEDADHEAKATSAKEAK